MEERRWQHAVRYWKKYQEIGSDKYARNLGIDGYHRMKVYLERSGYPYSAATIHKHRKMKVGLSSLVCSKKPGTIFL